MICNTCGNDRRVWGCRCEEVQQIADLRAALAAERKRVAELEQRLGERDKYISIGKDLYKELREDRKRLDLMEELHDAAPWPYWGAQNERVWVAPANNTTRQDTEHLTLREAIDEIDAAREAAKG